MNEYNPTISVEETEQKTPSYESLNDEIKGRVDKTWKKLLPTREQDEGRHVVLSLATHLALWHKKRADILQPKLGDNCDALGFSLASNPAKPIMRPIIEYIAKVIL